MAVYKTFGNTAIGANNNTLSQSSTSDSWLRYCFHAPEYTGNVKSMTAYIYTSTTNLKFKCALYQYRMYNTYPYCVSLLAETEENSIKVAWNWEWVTFPFKKPFRVIAGRIYQLVIWSEATSSAYIKYDTSSYEYIGGYYNVSYGDWEDPMSPPPDQVIQDRDNSLYVTYEPTSSLQVSLGADRKPTRVNPIPWQNYWGTGKPGSFGGYNGLGKMHLGLHRHPHSRVR